MARKAITPAGKPELVTSKHAGGRPSEMTPEVVERMLEGLKLGIHYEDVADFCGKHRTTVWRWMEAARAAVESGEATDEQDEFCNAIKEAQLAGTERRLKKIESGDPGWQGCAWIQERRFRKRWGQTIKQELTGKDGGPIEVNLTPEQKAARVQEVLANGLTRKPVS